MTHTKFIELLNLYLDHEISMEDAAALEAEIQRDPKRRDIYRQYCQMHRGCQELASAFATEGAISPERRSIVPPASKPARSVFNSWTYGAAAMAACAAFAVVTFIRQPAPSAEGTLASATPSAPQQTVATAAPQPAPATSSVYSLSEFSAPRSELHSVFTPTLVNLTTVPREKSSLYATASGARFDWMDDVKLAPVEGDEFSFRVRPVVVEGDRTYRSQRPFEGKVEMTAFQFQR